MHLAEVGGLCGPIVHLYVDVGMDVGVPGSIGAVVPDTLQVAGEVNTARRRDLKVTTIVEIQLLKHEVTLHCSCIICIDHFIGGHYIIGTGNLKCHAVVILFVIGNMLAVKSLPALCGGGIGLSGGI